MTNASITLRRALCAGAALCLATEVAAAQAAKPTAQSTKAAVQSKATAAAGFSPAAFKKPSEDELRRRLTPVQFQVTQYSDTEMSFRNPYWDNHAAGIYVDIVSGEPLFSSLDKYESGTGWPSFTRPLVPANIKTKVDRSFGETRTEVRSAYADSHLGHLFDDGPQPTGLRYCMNSASMRFIPADSLVAAGYGQFAKLFKAPAKK